MFKPGSKSLQKQLGSGRDVNGVFKPRYGESTPPPPPWAPTDLPNLQLWLRGDDVTTESGRVTSWNDKSGNSRHFTAPSGDTRRPSLLAADINGKDVVEFNGSNQYLTGNSDTFLSTTVAHTVIVVKKHDGLGGANEFDVLLNFKANNSRIWQLWRTNSASYRDETFGFAGGMMMGAGSAPGTAYHATVITYNGSGTDTAANWNFEQDGVGVTVATTTSGTATNSNEIGRWSSSGLIWDGKVAEVIVMSSSISSGDRTSLESYLNTRYGITFS